jgi:ankyrin repeat protein
VLNGVTALHLSAANGHVDCTRVLLRAGSNPSIKASAGPHTGKNAYAAAAADSAVRAAFAQELYQQAALGNAERVRCLLACGVSPEVSDGSESADTPLHWVSQRMLTVLPLLK